MFRAMRRINQELTHEENEKILAEAPSGVLAVHGDNGYPYAVPLNFAYSENAIYFHCAKSGHKLEAIEKNEKVSFCVVAKDKVIPQKFAADYYSVIAFGKAKIISEREEMLYALRLINKKLAPKFPEEGEIEIKKSLDKVCIVKIEIDCITGKAAIAGIRDTSN